MSYLYGLLSPLRLYRWLRAIQIQFNLILIDCPDLIIIAVNDVNVLDIIKLHSRMKFISWCYLMVLENVILVQIYLLFQM